MKSIHAAMLLFVGMRLCEAKKPRRIVIAVLTAQKMGASSLGVYAVT